MKTNVVSGCNVTSNKYFIILSQGICAKQDTFAIHNSLCFFIKQLVCDWSLPYCICNCQDYILSTSVNKNTQELSFIHNYLNSNFDIQI